MSNRVDQVNLQLNVNSNEALNRLNNLRKEAARIGDEMKGLRRGTAEYIAKNKELSAVTSEMSKLQKTIGITSLNQKELVAELRKLNAIKGSLTPFSNEFKDLQKQIKGVENRLYDVRHGVTGFASMFSKLSDQVKQFGVAAAAYLGFQFVSNQFRSILQGAGKLSDQLADLRRVAGLTADEADNLNASLKNIDTRTSTGGLREIAIIAGRLGVAKEDILEFTRAVDMLVVSLGDELGDADTITTQLGKILTVFDGEVTGDNITRLGNAIVELANSGAASGGFIVDFNQRLSGIAKSAGIGLGALSGLGAGLEEMGARVESSATAIQKLVVSIASDIPAAAKIAGMSAEEFNSLFTTDPTEALLRYSEGLVKNKQNFAEVTASLKDAGEEGARTIETISKLGESADMLRSRIKLGADALQENSAITEAFAIKNQTLAATMDKLAKEFNRLVTSPAVTNFLSGAIESALSFINIIKSIPFPVLVIGFTTVTAAILAYTAAKIKSFAITVRNTAAEVAQNAVLKLKSVFLALTRLAVLAYSAAQAAATGNTVRATAAMRLFNTTLKASPIGLIVTLLGAMALALYNVFKNTNQLVSATTLYTDTVRQANEEIAKQRSEIQTLTGLINSNTLSTDNKKEALAKLIAISPEYLSRLTLENIATREGKEILDAYNKALEDSARIKAANAIKDKLFQKQMEQEIIRQELEMFKAGGFKNRGDLSEDAQDVLTQGWGDIAQATQKAIDDIDSKIKKSQENVQKATENIIRNTNVQFENRKEFLRKEIRAAALAAADIKDKTSKDFEDAQKKIKELQAIYDKEILGKNTAPGTTTATSSTTTSTTTGTATKNKNDNILKEMEAFNKELEAIRRKAELGQLTEAEREIEIVKDKYADLLTRAKSFWAENTAIGKQKIAEILQLRDQEIAELQKKLFADNAEGEYAESLRMAEEYFNKLQDVRNRQYAEGLISKEQFEADSKAIEKQQIEARLQIAADYAENSKSAAKDYAKFRIDLEKFITAELIAEGRRRAQFTAAENAALLKLNLMTARDGSKAQLEAQKAILRAEFEEKVKSIARFKELNGKATEEETEQYKLAKEELRQGEEAADIEHFKGRALKVLEWANYAAQAMASINTIISNAENAELQKDRARNKKKQEEFKNQLDNKLISQKKYDQKMADLQKEQDKKESEVKRKQAKREKVLNLFQAVVNTASAVVEALPNIPLSIAVGLMGALQIGAIASAPLPEFGRGGKLTRGPKHRDKERGLHVVNPRTGKTEMLLEQGEGVINNKAMRSRQRMTISGTPGQIASAVNSSTGGVNWEPGANIQQGATWQRQAPQMRSGFVRTMATGGVAGPMGAGAAPQASGMEDLIAEFRILGQKIDAFDRERKSFVVLSDLDAKQDLLNAAQNAGRINQ